MEIKEKTIKEKTFLDFFSDFIVIAIKFLIGFCFCCIATIPFLFLLHLYCLEKYGSFLTFTLYDVCFLAISNIIFWLKIYHDSRETKK